MPRPPRILLPHTVALLTSRIQQGLPFVYTPLMNKILWSALAVAQTHHPVKVIAFVVMKNHVHLIVLVEDPSTVEGFMERFKCETAHAINRLLGRRQVTVWCEGYDSPAILTIHDLVEKLAYLYANPIKAYQCATIADYGGISSWHMFSSGQASLEVSRVRRTFLNPLPKGRVPSAMHKQLACNVEQQSTEKLIFRLTPDAWIRAFPNYCSVEKIHDEVRQRVNTIEKEMSEVLQYQKIRVPAPGVIDESPIDCSYRPTKYGRRMWCICGDIALRVTFIAFIQSLRTKAREVRRKWLEGRRNEPFVVGLFPPSPPLLAHLNPGFVRLCLGS